MEMLRGGWDQTRLELWVQIGVLRDLFCQLRLLYSVKGQREKRSGPEKQSGQRDGGRGGAGQQQPSEEFPLGVGDLGVGLRVQPGRCGVTRGISGNVLVLVLMGRRSQFWS